MIPENLEVWMANGVNRMSIGVQSFNTEARQMVGRLDTKETVLGTASCFESLWSMLYRY